jgi:hypothetical protein
MITPVSGTMRWLPKSRLIVVITEIARPVWSAAAIWEVPGLMQSQLKVREYYSK